MDFRESSRVVQAYLQLRRGQGQALLSGPAWLASWQVEFRCDRNSSNALLGFSVRRTFHSRNSGYSAIKPTPRDRKSLRLQTHDSGLSTRLRSVFSRASVASISALLRASLGNSALPRIFGTTLYKPPRMTAASIR